MTDSKKLKYRFHPSYHGNLIDGQFQIPADPNGEWEIRSPADRTDFLGKCQYSFKTIEQAIHAAHNAFRPWAEKSILERGDFLKKFQATLIRRTDELAEILAREIGLPLWDAQSEIQSSARLLQSYFGEGIQLLNKLEIPNILENTKGVCRFRPRGIFAIISSFSSPILMPCEHILSALLTGNTVVFKPSEKTVLTSQILSECLLETGLPRGVFNLIQGEKEVGRRLATHESIHGILFTGSYETGVRIKQDTLQQHWKFLLLEMGGKNPVLVWEDTNLEFAVRDTLVGAFATAGQRGTSTSRILVHQKLFDAFKTKFHALSKSFVINHPLSNPFMGPLIDSSSVDRYMKFLGIASREGCEMVMRGKSLDIGPQGNYVAPSICWVKNSSISSVRKSIFQQTEMMAPAVALYCVNELEEALALANTTQYGLATSVYTKNKTIYEKCLDGLEFGLIHWNKPTTLVSPRLPHGRMKKSGNHFISGLNTLLSCTIPIASLEAEKIEITQLSNYPGLNGPGLN